MFDIFGSVVEMGIGSETGLQLVLQLEWLIHREVVWPKRTSSRFDF